MTFNRTNGFGMAADRLATHEAKVQVIEHFEFGGVRGRHRRIVQSTPMSVCLCHTQLDLYRFQLNFRNFNCYQLCAPHIVPTFLTLNTL